MRTPLTIVALVVVIAVAALAVVTVTLDHTTVATRTISTPVREIVVRSGAGNIELVPARLGIEVRETRHHVFSRPTYEQDLQDGVLTVDSGCGGLRLNCYADLRITVPARVPVTVRTDSGDVVARAIGSRVAHLRSDSGDVRAQFAGRQALVWARTGSGNVLVSGPAMRAVDARSDSGAVGVGTATAPRRIVAGTDSGGVRVIVPAGPYAIDAGSDSGDVAISGILRKDRAPGSIDAHADSGDVTVQGG